MTTADKFKHRKRARLYAKLAYLGIGIFFLNLAIMIYWRTTTDVIITNGFYMGLIAFLILAPVFLGIVLTTFSHMEIIQLNHYKYRITEYRVRKYFNLAMDCIMANDFEGAKYYFNGFIPVKHETRSYLYGIMIYMATQSEYPERKEKGYERLAAMKEYYSPNTVKL
jgi:hypothetical protein